MRFKISSSVRRGHSLQISLRNELIVLMELISCTGAFCQPCSLVQESREIEEEEEAIRTGGDVPEPVYRDEEEVVAVVA